MSTMNIYVTFNDIRNALRITNARSILGRNNFALLVKDCEAVFGLSSKSQNRTNITAKAILDIALIGLQTETYYVNRLLLDVEQLCQIWRATHGLISADDSDNKIIEFLNRLDVANNSAIEEHWKIFVEDSLHAHDAELPIYWYDVVFMPSVILRAVMQAEAVGVSRLLNTEAFINDWYILRRKSFLGLQERFSLQSGKTTVGPETKAPPKRKIR